MAIGRTNCGIGGSIGGLPQFTYTGTYTLLDDGDKNWRVKFLTSGVLTVDKPITVDIFVVGGGAGGGSGAKSENGDGGGGGSGYTLTVRSVVLEPEKTYTITIGAGGAADAVGGTTSIAELGIKADGGQPGKSNRVGGKGGSGGGGNSPGDGGTDGSNGSGSNAGIGQGTTTREFEEETGDLYASGGAANISGAVQPDPIGENTGTGGKGAFGNKYASGTGNPGYSGIAVIRNHREAA